MGIFTGKNNKGKTIYGIDFYDASGKRVRKIIGEKRCIAEAALAKKKTMRFEEKVMGFKRFEKVCFSELVEEYEKYSKATFEKASHQTNMAAKKSLLPVFGNKYIDEISPKDIENYKIAAMKDIKPATINRYLTTLKRMLNLAKEWGYVKESLGPIVKKAKEPPGRLRYLSKEEIPRLLEACKKLDHLYIIVLVALNTGMRRGEILSLRWSQVNLENGLIHLHKTKSNKRRDIPIHNLLKSELESWKKKSSGEKLFNVNDIKHQFQTAMKKAGINEFRFHDLRHTFASQLVMSGVDLATVSQLMGHSTIDMTMRYSHLSPDHRMKAVERMVDMMGFSQNLDNPESV